MRLLLATLTATACAQNAKLVIVAQFKNEAESLPQWLDHYLTDEGVSTMLLIDEAVTTLEDAERTGRRVLGGAHPTTAGIEHDLQNARAALAARETPSPSA